MSNTRSELRRALHTLAFRQAGYFSAAQAVAAGYSYQAQKYHVDAGNWERVGRGILRLAGWPSGADDDFIRWTLWSGGRAVVSHDSALVIHGLSDVNPAKLHLSVPPGFRAVDGRIALHVNAVDGDDKENHEGWSVTTPLRSLLDTAASSASQETVDRAVADALRLGLITGHRAVADALRLGLITGRRALRATSDASDRAALRLERALASASQT